MTRWLKTDLLFSATNKDSDTTMKTTTENIEEFTTG